MTIRRHLFAFFAMVGILLGSVEVKAQTPATPPFDLGAVSAYFVKDVKYGPHERHTLDVFLPRPQYDNRITTPLVLYIHGGGFTSGSKESIYTNKNLIINLLSKGIAFATINYPLLEAGETEGVIKSLNGSKRALQYIRRYSYNFNIIEDKVIAMGTSAGASSSLWLAFHDDMKNLASMDPVEQQSTKVLAVVASETQSTLDVVRWEDIFSVYNLTLTPFSSIVKRLYGISSLSQLTAPAIVAYRQNVDLLALMDSSDPEIWIRNSKVAEVNPGTNTSTFFHHPYHAKALMDQAATVNLSSVFYIPVLNIHDPSNESMEQFIFRKFQ